MVSRITHCLLNIRNKTPEPEILLVYYIATRKAHSWLQVKAFLVAAHYPYSAHALAAREHVATLPGMDRAGH